MTAIVAPPVRQDTTFWGVPVLRLPPVGAQPTCNPPVVLPAYPVPPEASSVTEIARFRWILGHHAAFLTWRTAYRALTAVLAREDEEAVRLAATAYDVYSALLLYTGSCTADVYASAIRPAMAAADPAFSGRWASDYKPLPNLLQEIRRTQSSRRLAPLLRAVRTNQLVHMSVASRLVPDGVSLLREAGYDRRSPVTNRQRAVFDEFFAVEHGPVSYAEMRHQIRGVFGAALSDLGRTTPYFATADGPHAEQLNLIARNAATTLCRFVGIELG